MRKLTEQDVQSVVGTVNEGVTIIEARVKNGEFSDSDHYGIALGKRDNGDYVTWEFKLNDNNVEFDFYWGHYFMGNRMEAINDYSTRDR